MLDRTLDAREQIMQHCRANVRKQEGNGKPVILEWHKLRVCVHVLYI